MYAHQILRQAIMNKFQQSSPKLTKQQIWDAFRTKYPILAGAFDASYEVTQWDRKLEVFVFNERSFDVAYPEIKKAMNYEQ